MFQKANFKKNGLIALSLMLVFTFVLVGTVSAAEFPPEGTIPAGQTINDDVFLAATDVVMDGVVEGMLVASGQTITINGTVHGDALLMAETIRVNEGAVIEGNLFGGGATILVNGNITGSLFGGSASIELGEKAVVGRNLYYGGYSLTTKTGSSIGSDLFGGTYQTILSGSILRDARIGAGAIELYGSIGRNAKFNVGNESEMQNTENWYFFTHGKQYLPSAIPAGLRIADSARINGNLTYVSSNENSVALEPAVAGTILYQTPVPGERMAGRYNWGQRTASYSMRGFSTWSAVQRFLTLLILGALAIWLLRKPLRKAVDEGFQQSVPAMGWGAVIAAVGFFAFFVVPVVFVLLAILLGLLSVGGLLFAWVGVVGSALVLAAMLFLFVIFTISKLVAAFIAGKWLVARLFPKSVENMWIVLLVGVSTYGLLSFIPVLGWLVGIAAALMGTGAIWLAIRKSQSKVKKVAGK